MLAAHRPARLLLSEASAMAQSFCSWLFSLICDPGRGDRLDGESCILFFPARRIEFADVEPSPSRSPSPSAFFSSEPPHTAESNIFDEDAGRYSPRGVVLVSEKALSNDEPWFSPSQKERKRQHFANETNAFGDAFSPISDHSAPSQLQKK